VRSFETGSEEETIALGRRIASELPKRAIVLLIGKNEDRASTQLRPAESVAG